MTNDPFRKEYRPLLDHEKEQLAKMKDTAQFLYDDFEELGPSREIALAQTKLEEAVMWATKHITK